MGSIHQQLNLAQERLIVGVGAGAHGGFVAEVKLLSPTCGCDHQLF
jgi:hypothetical protein